MKGPLSPFGCPSNCLTKMASDINSVLGFNSRFPPREQFTACGVLCSNKREGLKRRLDLSFSHRFLLPIHLIHIHRRSHPPFHGRRDRQANYPMWGRLSHTALLQPRHSAWDFFSLTQCFKEENEAAPPPFWTDRTEINMGWMDNQSINRWQWWGWRRNDHPTKSYNYRCNKLRGRTHNTVNVILLSVWKLPYWNFCAQYEACGSGALWDVTDRGGPQHQISYLSPFNVWEGGGESSNTAGRSCLCNIPF